MLARTLKWLTSPVVVFPVVAVVVLVVSQLARVLFSANAVYNPGIAFSLVLPPVVIYAVSVLLMSAIGVWFYHTHERGRFWAISLALIIGGGMSNLLDRGLFAGRVVDYIPVGTLGVINLADIMITIGILLAISQISNDKSQS